MIKYIFLLLLLAGCTSTQTANIPTYVAAPQVKPQSLQKLPILLLNSKSSYGDVITAAYKTIYLQKNYIAYLLRIGGFKQ